jgi:hypothetical protein
MRAAWPKLARTCVQCEKKWRFMDQGRKDPRAGSGMEGAAPTLQHLAEQLPSRFTDS